MTLADRVRDWRNTRGPSLGVQSNYHVSSFNVSLSRRQPEAVLTVERGGLSGAQATKEDGSSAPASRAPYGFIELILQDVPCGSRGTVASRRSSSETRKTTL